MVIPNFSDVQWFQVFTNKLLVIVHGCPYILKINFIRHLQFLGLICGATWASFPSLKQMYFPLDMEKNFPSIRQQKI